MGWIGCVRCKKFRRDFVLRTFALVRPVLHRVSLGNQTVLNARKQYETCQNLNLGSNGVDRVRSLRNILIRLHVTNFCTSSARFAPSFISQPNGTPKHEFRVQWGRSGVFVAKTFDATSWHELLLQFGLFCTEFRKATKRFQIHPNSTKCEKT